MEISKTKDSHSSLEKPRQERSAFPHLHTGPAVIFTAGIYLTEGVGQIKRSEVSHSGWTKPA